MMADQDLQGLVQRGRDAITAFRDATREGRTISFRERDPLVGVLHDGLNALERLGKELADSQDRVAGIHNLAKVLSLEDAMSGMAGESEVAVRLRLFEAIATLRVEVATNKGQPKLVQAVCETAARNLARAEVAEAEAQRLSQRGTCNSCTHLQMVRRGQRPGFNVCDLHIKPLIADLTSFYCAFHESQPTATEEASK